MFNILIWLENPAHLRRKRQKTGGDPMHLLLQQQQNQQHKPDHPDGRQIPNISPWNPSNVPAIKTEPPETSPQPFGNYRATPTELTPSPQPLSPTNNSHSNHTMSSYSMVTIGPTSNPNLMSPNHQYNAAVGGLPEVVGVGSGGSSSGGVRGGGGDGGSGSGETIVREVANHTTLANPLQDYNTAAAAYAHEQQHVPLATSNPTTFQGNPFSVATGEAGGWEPKYFNNFISNQVAMHNLLATSGNAANVGVTNSQHWNLMHHHQQLQQHLQQQQQQLQTALPQQRQSYVQESRTEAAAENVAANTATATSVANTEQQGPTISNLLSFDSEQLVRIDSEDQQMLRLNSEDLQISNLSIST